MKIDQSNYENDNLILCQTELSSQWSRTRDVLQHNIDTKSNGRTVRAYDLLIIIDKET